MDSQANPFPSTFKVKSAAEDGENYIGTHSGTFHCDEALACGILKTLPEFSNYHILRTRNQSELEKCKVVADVGGVYDSKNLRFDHHQKTFDGTMSELGCVTRLSSAGLIYRHFGHTFLREVIKNRIPDDVIEKVIYRKIYLNFIEEVDGVDNGINPFEGPPKYAVTSALSSRVGNLNPAWNSKRTESEENENFIQAVCLATSELISSVEDLVNVWWPARELVENSMKGSKLIDPSGQILRLDHYCPWKQHLHDLEKEMGIFGRTKFVLYSSDGKEWRLQTVPLNNSGFENRVPLLKEWWGLRSEKLCEASGIQGCVFVHANGFIGGNETFEGAFEMAQLSIKQCNGLPKSVQK